MNNCVNNKFQYWFNTFKSFQIDKFKRLQNLNCRELLGSRKWILNISDVDVPEDVSLLIRLGPKFSVPFTHEDFPNLKLLKNLQYYIISRYKSSQTCYTQVKQT